MEVTAKLILACAIVGGAAAQPHACLQRQLYVGEWT
jgi:hypothetical protein